MDDFYIFVSSGEIHLKNELDYETTEKYEITVVAQVRKHHLIPFFVVILSAYSNKGSWGPTIVYF